MQLLNKEAALDEFILAVTCGNVYTMFETNHGWYYE